MEIWKDIPDTNGFYQVSNLGRVRSVDRDVVCYNGTIQHHKGRMLKFGENHFGYYQVHYPTTDGKGKTMLVHRLVALLFVDGYKEGLEVNHKDSDRHNNKANNLEWCNRQYNNTYGSAISKRVEKYKKLSWVKRTKIIVVYKDGVKVGEFNGYKEAGEALGFTLEYVSQLANGRKHKHYKVEIKRPRSYQIAQYKDGELIAIHPSLTSAQKGVGVSWHLELKHLNGDWLIHGYTLKAI